MQDPDPDRLILLTAGSAAIPAYYFYADAHLISAAQPGPGGLPPLSPPETALSGDPDALVLAMTWALALALVSAGVTVAALRRSRWLAYLAGAPLLLAVLWNLYQNLAMLLPNVY